MSAGIVLLAGEFPSTAILYNYLKPRFPLRAVVIESRPPRLALVRNRLRKLGLAKVFGQLCFRSLAVPILTLSSRSRLRQIEKEFALDRTPIPAGEITRVDSVNSSASIAALQEIAPQVVLVNGTRIISSQVLRTVAARFINLHGGITPLYRGVHGAYWALVQRQPQHCGVTIHRVDEGIDTGAVLAQASIFPTARDNFITYQLLQVAAGLPLLDRVLSEMLQGREPSSPPLSGESRLWTHPTLFEYLRYRRWGVK